MTLKLDLPSSLPKNCVLGLNYSGMHDSAVALVAPDGEPLFACSLERVSRVKQDGRWPEALLDIMPWDKIATLAISTPEQFAPPSQETSKLLSIKLPSVRADGLHHGQAFYDFLNTLPKPRTFVCHQMAHAASSFWGSGFEEALCLTYDGGMCNSPWFGGLYKASRKDGIAPLDQFSALHYAKITSLYTFVTALLGFTPNKHEGKITGLAAYGKENAACKALLQKWFREDFLKLESVMDWLFTYSAEQVPTLLTNTAQLKPFMTEAQEFSREDLAFCVQKLAEEHVLDLLTKARAQGWTSQNICLAGGLFANVKINQRVVESGFDNLFVAPPMTDDGTALGAAWHVLSEQKSFAPKPLHAMYLGGFTQQEKLADYLAAKKITFTTEKNPATKIAALLSEGAVVAIFQGAIEFGPRALGNRSILAEAREHGINKSLNQRLNRTEFMPFAPITRVEDAHNCYLNITQVAHSAEFMTVTVNCTEAMTVNCPAVVHVDGTARPQLVVQDTSPLIHAILTAYKTNTGRASLVNTSFNIHEEPIVCSVDDALQGFFESGLDYLYLGDGILISFAENTAAALHYVQEKLRQPSQKAKALAQINTQILAQLEASRIDMKDKECIVQKQSASLKEKEQEVDEKEQALITLTQSLIQKEKLIQTFAGLEEELKQKQAIIAEQALALVAYRAAIGVLPGFIRRLLKKIFHHLYYFKQRIKSILRPRLGHLNQYMARSLTVQAPFVSSVAPEKLPSLSIVTPSYNQGHFLAHTIESVLSQNYPRLEYFVQDGGSNDTTVQVLEDYRAKLSGFVSEKDKGQTNAINLGFAKTSGEIMAWLNSDDLLMPDTLLCVGEFFANHPDVDVIYGNRLMIDEDDLEIGRWIMPGHDDTVLSYADFIPQETLFWRRSAWEKIGGALDENFRFAMDWDFLTRLRNAGCKFAHIDRFLGAFRIHAAQKTSAVINEVGYQEMDKIRLRELGFVPNQDAIRRATRPYLLKHIGVDLLFRIRQRMQTKKQ